MVYQLRMKLGSNLNDKAGLPVIYSAEQLSRDISAGLLAEGQRLPAERQMAKDQCNRPHLTQITGPLLKLVLPIPNKVQVTIFKRTKMRTPFIHFPS